MSSQLNFQAIIADDLHFVFLKAGVKRQDVVITEQLVLMVKERIGAFANFKQVIIIEQLPKTRSGKILRDILRKIACGEQYQVPPAIDQPDLLSEIEDNVARVGLCNTR